METDPLCRGLKASETLAADRWEAVAWVLKARARLGSHQDGVRGSETLDDAHKRTRFAEARAL